MSIDLAPPSTDETVVRRRRAGGRRARRQAQRRRDDRRRRWQRRVRGWALVVATLAILAGVVVVAATLIPSADEPLPPSPGPAGPAPGQESTAVALVRTHAWGAGAGGPSGNVAVGITLLITDATGPRSVVFVPSTLLVEVPGVGLDRLGLAQQYGGAELLVASAENALGVEVDGAIVVDDQRLADALAPLGPVTVDVPQRLVERDADGTGALLFAAGQQPLSGDGLVQLATFQQRGEAELDVFTRQQVVLDAVLGAANDPDARREVVDALVSSGRVDVPTPRVAGLLTDLADAAAEGALGFHLLPVTPLGTRDARLGTSYQLRPSDAHRLFERIAPSLVPAGGGADAVPVRVLNGVGRPGIGQAVDRALEGLGVRIVLSDNAQRFDHDTTQIVIYDEEPASVELAEQVRSALGVGSIVLSRQPQSVVDLTIVVGADFVADNTPLSGGV